METKLARISEIAKAKPKEVFTSLYHYLNEAMLIQCHNELSGDKAAGVDEITKEEYALYLKQNPLPRPKIKRNLWVTGQISVR